MARRIGDNHPGRPAAGVREAARRTDEALDAAAAVFARLGYHGASTRDIADRLSIRQASVYYYFRSKEAALEQVCLFGLQDVIDGARRILGQRGSAQDRVIALVRHHLTRMSAHPDHARVFLTQRRYLTGEARERVRQYGRDYERIMTSAIADGVDRGEFRTDPPPADLAMAVLGLCNAALMWHGAVPRMTADRAIRIVTPFVLNGLQADGASQPRRPSPDQRAPAPSRQSIAFGDNR